MDLKNISNNFYPAYTWFWNNTITRDGIDRQIDEMYENGIRAFYVIGEPENWFPDTRATHLSPKYLSDEYLELLVYAFKKAKEKGIACQYEVMGGHTGTNGWHMQVAREGIPTSVLSLPLKYMHTPVEVLSLEDVEAVSQLLAAFTVDLGKEAETIC